MATRSELRGRVKEILMLPETSASVDSGTPSNAAINRLIEQARRKYHNELARLYPERLAADSTQTYTAGAESVTLSVLPKKILQIHALPPGVADSATAYQQKYELEARARGEFAQQPAGGRPWWYAVEGTKLFLRPVPASATVLYISSVGQLTDLADDNASPSEVPADYHDLFAHAAAAAFKARAGDADAVVIQSMADELWASMAGFYESMIPDQGFRAYRTRMW